MTYQQDGYFQVGQVVFPLLTGSGHTSLQDLDPVLFKLLDYYKFCVVQHAGVYWNSLVSNSTVARSDLLNIDWQSVGQAVHYAIPPLKTEQQFRFPLLSVFRSQTKFQHRSKTRYEALTTIQVVFALPPLIVEQIDVVDPILHAIENIVLDRTFVGYDSSYNSGEQVFLTSGCDEIKIIGSEYGQLPSLQGKIECRSVAIQLEMHEQRNLYLGQFDTLQGFQATINLVDGYPASPIQIAQVTLPASATITSVYPTSASSAGGSYVNILGSGFTSATGVNICGQLCKSFRVKTDSLIQVLLPPGAPHTTGNVLVSAANGIANLANSFTYI